MENHFDKIIDISIPLCAETIIYPGDPVPEYDRFLELKKGEIANVGRLKHGIHHGTHVDVPFHFDDSGRRIEEMPLTQWLGPALVVDATGERDCISAQTLEGIPTDGYENILFKTKNSTEYYQKGAFYEKFIYLEQSACEALVESRIKTVGLDYITVDPYGSKEFPAHHTLLKNGVCILESIDLLNVDAGEYYLMCLPLKLRGTDGANARAILLEKGFCV